MPKFRLYTTSEVHLEHIVEATSPEEALAKVNGAIYVNDFFVIGLDPQSRRGVVSADINARISVDDKWHCPAIEDVEEFSE